MKYEVVLANKFYLRDVIENITLKDSLDQIAYQADIRVVITPDFPNIEPGQEIRISGIPFGSDNMVYLLYPGVVWECYSTNPGLKHMDITVYDRTIYIAKSEDEYLMPSGQTASQRLRKYATDWGIPLGNIPDTKVKLGKGVYRSRAIYQMIMSDLKETVKAGGDMYIPRMTPKGLELFKVGSNQTVWVMEQNEEVLQRRTLEGAVTKVKVLGKTETKKTKGTKSKKGKPKVKVELPSKVLAIESGETAKLGTLQKVVQDTNIKSAAEAKQYAKSLLTGIQETFTVSALDINTIRAGDAVILNGMRLIVMSVSHDLGDPGHMRLELAFPGYVQRRYFFDGPV
ncbi:phage portal protein [Paenibacillus sp. MSJ-34]|uniref:XkdQ/YqbQ family protein n=1 Tax=Paenibacillus sp. MSJ-34 TaxID=2841529 RepID=UPI001C11DEF9|nr:phage portal protein [Paenibacillus sp. MSJ-34]MBU5441204.1 phage portal protein [Paenibacillus sp. MSJ-34]